MKTMLFALPPVLFLASCDRDGERRDPESIWNRVQGRTANSESPRESLRQARKGFRTRLAPSRFSKEPASEPPPRVFRKVRYRTQAGPCTAYLTPDPNDGRKHPAIIWITGGDCNSIGDVWLEGSSENEQTASAYRKAGIVMMFPSLRGGNDNPGVREGFLGEVDDVLAAADHLARTSYVDPERIYLGGHSTGGTLALLVAEYSNRFRAVISFGPVEDVGNYGEEFLPFDASNPKEVKIRSPRHWLESIETPTFVMEGTGGNLSSLQALARSTSNPNVHVLPVRGADHFNVLAPVNRLIATKILRDAGPECNLKLTEHELAGLFARRR